MSSRQTGMVDKRKRLVGRVVGNKAEKTLVVLVVRRVFHPVYGKLVSRERKYQIDFRSNQRVNLGDNVEILEVGRVSKSKSWAFSHVVVQAV